MSKIPIDLKLNNLIGNPQTLTFSKVTLPKEYIYTNLVSNSFKYYLRLQKSHFIK